MRITFTFFILLICSVNVYSQTVESYLKSAIEKQSAGDNDGAVADCNKALGIDPSNAIIFNVRGLSQYNLGKYGEAIEDYNRTIHTFPTNAIAYNYRGSAKYYLGQYSEAIHDFTEAIHLYSKYVSAFNNRANAKVKLEMFPEAVVDYNEAININPDNASAYVNRAYARNKLTKYADAIDDCNKALSIDPKSAAGAYRNRGNAKIGLGLYDDGIIDCNKAISLDLENAKAYNYRGYAYYKLGKYNLAVNDDRASVEFEKSDDITPFWDYSEDAAKLLKQTANTVAVSKPAPTVAKPAVTAPAGPAKVIASIAPVEANGVNTYVNYQWIKPVADFSQLADGVLGLTENNEVNVKLRVVSNSKLDKSKLHLFVNDQDLSNGNKMTVADIEELKNKGNNNIISFNATVKVGMNKSVIKLVYNGFPPSDELVVNYAPLDIKLHVLAIGTHASNLKYPEKDATDFANIFSDQQGEHKLFHDVSAETLLGDNAKAQAIANKVLDWGQKKYNEHDVLMLFISSHGFTENGRLLLTGSDFKSTSIKFTTVDFKQDILDPLEAINCKKFVFIDACNSGAGISGGKATDLDVSTEIKKMINSGNSTTIITSSNSTEQSWEDESWGNGAFTKAIKEALQEMKADKDENGVVSMNELYDYIKTRVADLIKLAGKKDTGGNMVTQTPMMLNPRGNVSVYLKKQ